MPVTTDDYVAISDLLGRYCWHIDAGDEEAWVSLWTEDAVFSGAMPEPVVGQDALRKIPQMVGTGGKGRHHLGSLFCDYDGADRNTIIARYYVTVTNWSQGGRLACFGNNTTRLVRQGDAWLIKRSDTVMFT